MLSEAEVKDKIEELKKTGTPASLVQAKQLEWVLGASDGVDEEQEEILNFLLTDRVTPPVENLWDKLPKWVQNHNLYTFHKQEEARKSHDLKGLAKSFDPIDNGYKPFSWAELLGLDVAKKIQKARHKLKKDDAYDSGFYTRIPDETADIETAELISSLQDNGKHRPLLDIDFEAVTIPSTTPGHCHLYINKELDWKDYKKLLNLLADLDIIEHGYRGASIARGYSALRLPWISKKKDEPEEIGRIAG